MIEFIPPVTSFGIVQKSNGFLFEAGCSDYFALQSGAGLTFLKDAVLIPAADKKKAALLRQLFR